MRFLEDLERVLTEVKDTVRADSVSFAFSRAKSSGLVTVAFTYDVGTDQQVTGDHLFTLEELRLAFDQGRLAGLVVDRHIRWTQSHALWVFEDRRQMGIDIEAMLKVKVDQPALGSQEWEEEHGDFIHGDPNAPENSGVPYGQSPTRGDGRKNGRRNDTADLVTTTLTNVATMMP